MIHNQRVALIFFGVLWSVAVLMTACSSSAESNPLPIQFESNAFTLRYPEGWQHQIPQTNMLFIASPEILSQQSGATVTIQRSVALTSTANTLATALDSYLERGPLRPDRDWQLMGEAVSGELDSYETIVSVVEGSEQAGTLPMRSEIYILQAESGFFFIITLTAPIEQWDGVAPVLAQIRDSIDILE